MSRIPPALFYLTIYNPTLGPDAAATQADDEDAEEQAQILFYTCRDRAVTRDKMLRQVGLAKALVNFAEIFHSTDPCQNVHSQCRRMVMVNPEPNFWIHAAVELAKTPRAPVVKPKLRDKGKGKAKEEEQNQVLQLEYHDGMLHDVAIRTHLVRGYEQFKLTHGSFSSIFSRSGKQALELQLERFFSVWAWSWDLDRDLSFGVDLGLPLHPSYQSIHSTVDDFSSQIPEGVAALVLTQSHVAPSSRYRSSQYPVALARHLMNYLTPTLGPATLSPSLTPSERPNDVKRGDHNNRQTKPMEPSSTGGFLGVSISVSMDVRKWTWPSFGKGSYSKELVANADNGVVPGTPLGRADSQVDQSLLEDAIASDNSYGAPMEKPCALDDYQECPAADTPRPSSVSSPTRNSPEALPNGSLRVDDMSMTVCLEKPQFTWTDVFIAPGNEPLATSKRRVYLLKRGQYALALLNFNSDDVAALVKPSLCLLQDVERIISEDSQHNMMISLPSANKILQPKDNHILKAGDYVNTSGEGEFNSDDLFEAKGILDRGQGVVEVFSRGLHPQHWHVVSRVTDSAEDEKREAYLEVSRKEATLSDVDNILRGLYRTCV